MDLRGGLFGLIIFVLDLWALFDLWTSPKEVINKVLWSLLILVLPLVGLIIYAIFGRERRAHTI